MVNCDSHGADQKPLNQDNTPAEIDSILEKEIKQLSERWTSVCLAFLDKIPALTQVNFLVAEADLVGNIVEYLKKVSIDEKEFDLDDGGVVAEFFLHIDELGIVARKLGASTQMYQAAGILASSALGALVAEYEAFISRFLNIISLRSPSAFLCDEDSISLVDLEKFSSFQEARESVLNSKIEALIQEKSHVELLKWIEGKFKVNLTSDASIISDFAEVCQRRHLIAHNGAKVNKKYLLACERAGCDANSLLALGDMAIVDRKYLRRATARVFQVGFYTLHIVWQKLLPKHRNVSQSCILTASHDFLENDLTKMARRMCEFALLKKDNMSDLTNAYFVINLAQSYAFDSLIAEDQRVKAVEQALGQRDWTVQSPTISLALSCLRRDFSKLAEQTLAAKSDGLNYHRAKSWNIFREVRELPEFIDHFPGASDLG